MYWDRTGMTRLLSSVTTKTKDPLGWRLGGERATSSEFVYRLLYNATETGSGSLDGLVSFILETEGLRRGVWDWSNGLDGM